MASTEDGAPRKVAVIANVKKSIGGGLDELRELLADAGYPRPLWFEVPKSKKAPKQVRKAVKAGADLVFVWGGDGMVQRCVDALAGAGVPVAVIPAGTANLLAVNLDIPRDLPAAVEIGLRGRRRRLDLGKLNGEHFAVMAGAGFDGEMIREADRDLKDKVGRLAYVWTGMKQVRDRAAPVTVRVDGTKWYEGKASCVLLGNVGTITGGIEAFEDAEPDDGRLEVGVATAEGALQWARTLGRMVAGGAEHSPFVHITHGKKIEVKFAKPMTYELDGGARDAVEELDAQVSPRAITICVPRAAADATASA
jgi:YegS/Rv2252/BmrU family lipid kinase